MEFRKDLITDSGMWGLWDYETHENINDYDDWEPLFCEDEDIQNQILQMSFVPVYMQTDGCRTFTLKVDEELSEREKQYVCDKSGQYLFYSSGKTILSGIDYINNDVSENDAIIFDLPKGFYSVSVYLIAWDDEPGAYLEDGSVSPDALPDFIVILKSNADENATYCQSLETFPEND